MGTRRSKHNKGRKPLYKHFERDTIRSVSIFDEPARPREKFVPPPEMRGNYTNPRNAKVVQLEDAVARYMARRQAPALEPEARPRMSERQVISLSSERIEISQADVLLQLFSERRITARQLLAGRVWQFNLHRATLQPARTIEWDVRTREKPYQQHGSVSEYQWQSMKRRNEFRREMGPGVVTLADFCLGHDWKRAGLMRALGVDNARLTVVMDDLLGKIVLHFGTQFVRRVA